MKQKNTVLISTFLFFHTYLVSEVKISMNQLLTLQEQAFIDQFAMLARGGIAQITPEQIKNIPTSIIPVITDDQLIQFTITQIPYFTVEHIQAFTPGQLAALTVPTQEKPSIPNQITALKNEHIQALTEDQIAGLTPNQLEFIFDNLLAQQISALNSEQIATLPNNQLTTLTTAQIAAFTPLQIGYFTPNQLFAVLTIQKNPLVNNLSPAQISGITISQINGMDATQRNAFFALLSTISDAQNPNKSKQLLALSGVKPSIPDNSAPNKKVEDDNKKLSDIQKISKWFNGTDARTISKDELKKSDQKTAQGAKDFFSKNNQIGKAFKKIKF